MEQETRPRHTEKEGNKPFGNKKVWLIPLIVAAVAAGGAGVYMHTSRQKVQELLRAEGIYHGITIDGTSVEGLSEAEAVALLEGKYQEQIGGQVLTLYYGENTEDTWEIPFREIGAGYDVEGAVKKAYLLGREGTEKERFAIGSDLLRNGEDIEVVYSYDEEMMKTKLEEVAEGFDCPAENSQISRVNGKFNITPEKQGRAMEKTKTAENIAAVLESKISGSAEIVAEVTEPKVTAADNEHVTDLIGTFSTTYGAGDKNRNNNLEVGCRYINGTIVAPGDVFSANVELGPQTAEGGYRNAGVYSNGKVEQGMAGGVCQITTTVYNAALMAELEIVERHPHSMTVGYVPLGRDAAVAGTYKDLKIKNNTEYPILIEASAGGGKLNVNIYGHEVHSAGRKVEFETVYEGTIPKPAEVVKYDPELPEGERKVTANGKTGSKVSVYKKVYQNGKQVSNEWFSSSTYRSTADQVTIGTKKIEQSAEETPTETPTEVPASAPVETEETHEF